MNKQLLEKILHIVFMFHFILSILNTDTSALASKKGELEIITDLIGMARTQSNGASHPLKQDEFTVKRRTRSHCLMAEDRSGGTC